MNLRSRLSRFYWKHDWFRRACNFFLIPFNLLALTFVLGMGFFCGTQAQQRWGAERLDSYSKSYFDATERYTACNETLRLRISEHNGCEAALRQCRERSHASDGN